MVTIEFSEAAAAAMRADQDVRLIADLAPTDASPAPTGPPAGPLAPFMTTGGMPDGGLYPGEVLHWDRPRVGGSYTVTVLADGCLEDPNGGRHTSPSRAAGVLAGGSFDGWTAWRRADGTLIDRLRG
jgi:hypothetical protein